MLYFKSLEFLQSLIFFIDYIKRKNVDCEPKMRDHTSLQEAITSCSRDSYCSGVVKSCNGKLFSSCKHLQQSASNMDLHQNLTFNICEELAIISVRTNTMRNSILHYTGSSILY